MPRRVVYVVCAAGEESLAELLAGPLQKAGYDVAHNGTIAVGESLVGEAEKALISGSPIILCATAKAVGSAWAHKIVNAAHGDGGVRVFVVKMERQAFVDQLALDGKIADYCNNPVQAIRELLDAVAKHFPPVLTSDQGNAVPAAGVQFLDELTEAATFDIQALERFRGQLHKEVAARFPSTLNPWEFLARASLTIDGRLTRTGALLFASDPTTACPTSMVKCAQYYGDDRAASRDMETFDGTVPMQIVAARQFVAERVRSGEAPNADQAQSAAVYDYPMIAVREIVANALVHRDYMSTDSCVHVRLFPDRLEVSSPGSWLGQDLQPGTEYSLSDLTGHSIKRNFRLAHILSWIRLVEGEGSGIPATLHACRVESSPPPTVVQQQGFVTVILRRRDELAMPYDARGEVNRSAEISLGPGLRSSLNCSILVTDIASFGGHSRSDADRIAIRNALYDILKSAFEEAEVSWAECYHEDRGDGILIVVPPAIATARLVDPMARELAVRLRQYNAHASDMTRIQLRAALHVGPVGRDAHGLVGQALVLPARIADAPVLKDLLAMRQADLAFAVSDYVYEHVVEAGAGLVDPARFERTEIQAKGSRITAWAHLAGSEFQMERTAGIWSASERYGGMLPFAAPVGHLPDQIRGRDRLLAEFRRQFGRIRRRSGGVSVIAGMGGVGKSTAALAAAQMAMARGWRVWWIPARDTQTLTGAMLGVLYELGAPESVTVPLQEAAPIAPSRAWEFLNSTHAAGKRWLLVYDGADQPGTLAAPGMAVPADGTGWLPSAPSGVVIVTTRNRDPHVWGAGVALYALEPLDDAAGAQMLRDLAPNVADPGGQQAHALARRLGGLPLALHLAGAYLASPFARWATFGDYHRALDSVATGQALGDIEESRAGPRTMLQQTWDLSLDAIAAEGHPQARQLLLLLSCYASATPIPVSLLEPLSPDALLCRPEANAPPGLGGDQDTERLRWLREGLQGLASTGLIDVTSSRTHTGAVTVHPVVADVNRSKLLAIDSADRAAIYAAAVGLLKSKAAGIDTATPNDWPAWRELAPHLNAMLPLAADMPGVILAQLLMISTATVDALLRAGQLAAAYQLAQAAASASECASPDDPARLTVRGSLAQALARQGRDDEAELLYRELLADQRRVLGEDNPRTLATVHQLAQVIGQQGQYTAADELYRTLLADQQRILGDLHPDTLATQNELALMIGLEGRYAEAEELYRQVLADRQRVFGANHPDTLGTSHRLAWLIGQQGRYAEAENIARQVLDDRKQLLGDDHPDTLASRATIAWLAALRGRRHEAEQIYRQVLDARLRVLGANHPDTRATDAALSRVTAGHGTDIENMEPR